MKPILLVVLLSALVDGEAHSGLSVTEINKKHNVHHLLYQGDILVSREHAEQVASGRKGLRSKRQAMNWNAWPSVLWVDGVNYFFDSSIPEQTRSAFRDAAKQWESHTCINFTENPSATDRVNVSYLSGCYSYVGRTGGEQVLSLGNGCGASYIAAHEIGHLLGFIHTHSRYDRDDYVKVVWEYIEPGHNGDFGKYIPKTNDNFGLLYDYGSIMHYAAADYSTNGQLTLRPLDYNYVQTIGGPFIGFVDYYMMNFLYNCTDRCKSDTSAKCENGGFPHPRDCSKCICPRGYGGDQCNERPPGCGETLQATSNWVTLTDMLDRQLSDGDYTECNYWIESPKGTVIELQIVDYPWGYVSAGCSLAGFEIKSNKNQTATGYRFCTPEVAGWVLRSHTNRLPVMTYSSYLFNLITTVFQYRYVSASPAS